MSTVIRASDKDTISDFDTLLGIEAGSVGRLSKADLVTLLTALLPGAEDQEPTWRLFEEQGATLDGSADDEAAVEAALAASASRYGKVAAVAGTIGVDDGERLRDAAIHFLGTTNGTSLMTLLANAEKVLLEDLTLTTAVGSSNAVEIDQANVQDTMMRGCDVETDDYPILINSGADGGQVFRSIGNRLISRTGDGIEWNLPNALFHYLLSMGDVVEGGLSGSGPNSGFAWGIANARFWSIVGGLSRGARQDAMHIEDGQRGGVASGTTMNECQMDAVRVIGPRGLTVTSGASLFARGEEIEGDTSGATAIIVDIFGQTFDLRTISGTFQNGETVTGADTAATATVGATAADLPQPEADPVALSAIHGTHTGAKTGYSGYRSHYQSQYPALWGSVLAAHTYRGYEYGVTLGENAFDIAMGLSLLDCDYGANLQKGAILRGELAMPSGGVALLRANSRTRFSGSITARTQPTNIVEFVGSGVQPGFEFDGAFSFPVVCAHTGGATSQNFKIMDLPDFLRGTFSLVPVATTNYSRSWGDVLWDGSALTGDSDDHLDNNGTISDIKVYPTNAGTPTDLNIRFYSLNAVTQVIWVHFKGFFVASADV